MQQIEMLHYRSADMLFFFTRLEKLDLDEVLQLKSSL